jgi:hypothetical protein
MSEVARRQTASHISPAEAVRSNEPLVHSVNEFRRIVPVGRTKVYALIASGKLKTIKIGSRTFITHESVVELAKEGAE